MQQRYRALVLKPVLASLLLVLAPLSATPAAGQEITLKPGQSCQSAACHEDLGKKNVVHMPAASGTTCVMCHEVQAPGQHDFELAAQGGELCSRCHNVLGSKQTQHMPVAMGMCSMCHEPHQSDNRKLLKATPVSGLCLGCHNPAMFEGETVHGPVAEGNCISCHEPHASEHAKLVKAGMPELCFGCHDRRQRDADGKSLPAVKVTFADAEINKHMPFAVGQCAMCHSPHAGPNHRLLNKPYPADFYTSYSAEKYFCFGCHDAGAFAEPRTMTATEFRNGNLNLHFRHVNRDKGRSCRACHHHHGARNDKLIRNTVPFGDRFIAITNFGLTETGGRCGPTCHLAVSYDRFEPVEQSLRVSPRPGDDATPEALEQARQQQMPEQGN